MTRGSEEWIGLDELSRAPVALFGRRLDEDTLGRALSEPWGRGLWLQAQGSHREALEHLAPARGGASASQLAHALVSWLAIGRPDRVVAHASAALGARELEAHTRVLLGLARAELGELDEAQRTLAQARTGCEDPRDRAIVTAYLGDLSLERGERVAARAWLAEAAAVLRNDPCALAWTESGLALSCSDPRDAHSYLRSARNRIAQSWLHRSVEVRAMHAALLAEPARDPAILDAVERRLREPAPPARVELRTALRGARALVDQQRWAWGAGLRVGPEHTWVETSGERISLERHPTLQRVLAALLRHRRAHPGEALDVYDLFVAAWPGDRARPDSVPNRVYVAVARLRKLGLRDAIRTTPRGFLIAPGLAVVEERGPDVA